LNIGRVFRALQETGNEAGDADQQKDNA